ncbi:MAG: helix-turn-helix domain-containing protein [Deltaproteobacteria bacterium]|nr:helix-turn-helix domain-containing protein [Deltaproteobacteria bacterium]
MNIEQRMLNTREIARFMGMSVRTIRYLVHQGRFPIPSLMKIGRRYMWDRKAVEDYLDRASGIDFSSAEDDVTTEIKRLKGYL